CHVPGSNGRQSTMRRECTAHHARTTCLVRRSLAPPRCTAEEQPNELEQARSRERPLDRDHTNPIGPGEVGWPVASERAAHGPAENLDDRVGVTCRAQAPQHELAAG